MKNKLVTAIAVLLGLITYAQEQGKVRLSIEAGYGFRTARTSNNVPDELKDYFVTLKSGFNIHTNLGVFIQPNWGLGLTYNRFQSDNKITFATPVNINGLDAFASSDDIRINFIAPEFLYRSLSQNDKHSFMSTFSIGYLGYKDEGSLNNVKVATKGGTLGLGYGFMYDFHITPTVAIGASAHYIVGSLSKLDISIGDQTETVDLPDDQRESLSRITINAGLRFYL